MIIVVVIVAAVAFLAIAIHLDEKRKKEARVLAEHERRRGIIAKLKDLSEQIAKDPDSQTLFKALDDIIVPRQQEISDINVRTARISIRISPNCKTKWSPKANRVIEVDTLPYNVAYTGDDNQVAFAYALINRYPFLCYRYISSVPGEGEVTTRELEKVYFEAFDDSGHHEPRVLSNVNDV